MNEFNNTSSIPTTWLFGKENGYGWNPVRGCKNEGCHLHQKKTGECWAAKICNRWAEIWARSEALFRYPIENDQKNESQIYWRYDLIKKIANELIEFKPTWFESQFQKEFPERRSCFFVFSQTDFVYIPIEWFIKVIDKIKQNNEDRAAAGLPLNIFQFLTRCKNAYFTEWPINCWLGITATNQAEYNERIIQMRDINNFWYVYLEPLRGPIDIISCGLPVPDWVIIGGGPDKIDPQWIRDIRDQCILLDIPFFFKQWGDMVYFENTWLRKRDFQAINRHQKRKGEALYVENLIDGEKWEQFPKV